MPTQLTRENLGFLLAKASQRWNEHLYARFRRAGFPQVRPAYGSILIPLFEEDGLRLSELARRARLSKQTMTTMIRLMERTGLVRRVPDPHDRRAFRVYLTPLARRFRKAAERALAGLEHAARAVAPPRTSTLIKAWLKAMADLR